MPFAIPDKLIHEVAGWVATYIGEQRAAFREKAQPIAEPHRKMLAPFFPDDVLDQVRVVHGRATEPAFYSQLRALGIRNMPPFSDMAGITFQDVVVYVDTLTPPLLFHELVHAVQYKHLGLRGFADAYVRGFLAGGSYENIPLEKQAYELEDRFTANTAAGFSVEEDVSERIRQRRF